MIFGVFLFIFFVDLDFLIFLLEKVFCFVVFKGMILILFKIDRLD